MTIKSIFQPFANLWTYYGYYRKARRIQSDWNTFVTEWNRIGGFKASTKQLIDLLDRFSLVLVEYATWTPIEADDQIAQMVRYVLTNHRSMVINIINWARQGREPSVDEVQALSMSAGSDEYGSPMTVLYILTTIFNALRYLRSLQTDGQPPNVDPAPAPKRPVINFIRKIFNKN